MFSIFKYILVLSSSITSFGCTITFSDTYLCSLYSNTFVFVLRHHPFVPLQLHNNVLGRIFETYILMKFTNLLLLFQQQGFTVQIDLNFKKQLCVCVTMYTCLDYFFHTLNYHFKFPMFLCILNLSLSLTISLTREMVS